MGPVCECHDIIEGPSDEQVKPKNKIFFRIRKGGTVIACVVSKVLRPGHFHGTDPETKKFLEIWYRKRTGGHMIVYPVQKVQNATV